LHINDAGVIAVPTLELRVDDFERQSGMNHPRDQRGK
jgi:hypothetical protein